MRAQALRMDEALLAEARTNTEAAAKDVAFLFGLAREICLTRAPELLGAHRDVVSLAPGFRQRGDGASWSVTSDVCIVLVVREKRALPADSPARLPRWLVTFADRGAGRVPFAMPIDVQDSGSYHRSVPHGDRRVSVHHAGHAMPERGSFACLVRLSEPGGVRDCLLSAQHVFSPSPDGDTGAVFGGLEVKEFVTGSTLARTLEVGGLIDGDEASTQPSFDVQLAEILDPAAVARLAALGRFDPVHPWVRSVEELLILDRDHWFELLSPREGVGSIRVTVSVTPHLPVPLPYELAGTPRNVVRTLYQTELIGFEAIDAQGSRPGDSGSPIVLVGADGRMTLVAMHIAGDDGLAWAIPAWRLFDLSNWLPLPAGATLAPMDAR